MAHGLWLSIVPDLAPTGPVKAKPGAPSMTLVKDAEMTLVLEPVASVINSVVCQDAAFPPPTRGLEVVANLTDADGTSLTVAVPHDLLARASASDAVARAIAASINNHIAVQGLHGLALPPNGSAGLQAVASCLNKHYPQAFGHAGPGASRRTYEGDVPHRDYIRRSQGSIGINVGQTYTKAAVLVAGGTTVRVERRPTFSNDGRSATGLRDMVLDWLRELDTASPGCASIGLSVGGMVSNGELIAGSGITSMLTNEEARTVLALPNDIRAATGRPVLVCQDVRAKALYHSISSIHGRTAMLLDLGTSLGGAILDPSGHVVPKQCQVGRMAIDVGLDARPRLDGGGVGLLSQYLSARGLTHTLSDWGIAAGSTVELDTIAHALEPAISARLVQEFSSLIAVAVRMLRSHIPMETVLMTGGLLALAPVREAVNMAAGQSPEVDFRISNQPVFDGALGAALASTSLTA